jgi:serine/threonine protein kinase
MYSETDQKWKITDFGISIEGDDMPMRTLLSRSTMGYRAPELLHFDDPNFSSKSDVWALGCIFYELATGKLLFKGDWVIHEPSVIRNYSAVWSKELETSISSWQNICKNI